jgi:hypothetical protein
VLVACVAVLLWVFDDVMQQVRESFVWLLQQTLKRMVSGQ